MGVKDCKEDKQMGTREIRSKRNLSENVKKRKILYFEHMMRECGSLEKEPYWELCDRDRTRMSWLDNITKWTQSAFKKTFRNTENREQWRRTVHNVVNPRIEED